MTLMFLTENMFMFAPFLAASAWEEVVLMLENRCQLKNLIYFTTHYAVDALIKELQACPRALTGLT